MQSLRYEAMHKKEMSNQTQPWMTSFCVLTINTANSICIYLMWRFIVDWIWVIFVSCSSISHFSKFGKRRFVYAIHKKKTCDVCNLLWPQNYVGHMSNILYFGSLNICFHWISRQCFFHIFFCCWFDLRNKTYIICCSLVYVLVSCFLAAFSAKRMLKLPYPVAIYSVQCTLNTSAQLTDKSHFKSCQWWWTAKYGKNKETNNTNHSNTEELKR